MEIIGEFTLQGLPAAGASGDINLGKISNSETLPNDLAISSVTLRAGAHTTAARTLFFPTCAVYQVIIRKKS